MNAKIPCFECQDGHYEDIIKQYVSHDSTGKQWIVENVPHMTCDKCGEVCFSGKASRMIDFALAEQGFPFRKRARLPFQTTK